MARPDNPRGNRFLAALMDAGGPSWVRHLERVDLKLGQVLHEPGRRQSHAYFPVSAVVSLVSDLQNGASTELAVVGHEGVVGISLFLDAADPFNRGSVLIAGTGFRIGAQAVQDAFDRSGPVRQVVLRYTQALATQIAQTAVCNRYHAIEQQLCGWLLHVQDRLQDGSELVVTQELIAIMLGVRRESVTKAVGQLQEAGLIHCTRGHVEVLDRAGIEQRSCGCHAVVRKEYDRLLTRDPNVRPADQSRRTSPAWAEAAQGRCTLQRELEATSEL